MGCKKLEVSVIEIFSFLDGDLATGWELKVALAFFPT
jgi:hypothetical protein